MNKFSIILPVKNGGHYVKLCVSSILNQTYSNFNLIVLDNCSSDGTTEWIQSLQDSRIKLILSAYPLTIEANWERILRIEKNEFITIIGHDDLLYPNFLDVNNTLINQFPNASLFTSHFNYIDKAGKQIRLCKPLPETLRSSELLNGILSGSIDIMGTGYVMRRADYDKVGGMPGYPNLLFADFELWVSLSGLSYMVASRDQTFSFRVHNSTTSSSTDFTMFVAFERLINFLFKLKQQSKEFDTVINRFAITFIDTYCKAFCHRLLRTPANRRNYLSVKSLIQVCKKHADRLVPINTYHPLNSFTIRLAQIIDSNALTRKLFLLFKKIYSKPFLK